MLEVTFGKWSKSQSDKRIVYLDYCTVDRRITTHLPTYLPTYLFLHNVMLFFLIHSSRSNVNFKFKMLMIIIHSVATNTSNVS